MISMDRLKACPECREVLPADRANPTAAGFYVNRRSATTVIFGRLCKRCTSEARKARRRSDPAFAARETEWRRRWLEKPGNRERQNRASREWFRRYRKTHREEINENARMGYRLRRERAGLPPRAAQLRKVTDGTRPEEPAGLFIAWLRAYGTARGFGPERDEEGRETWHTEALATELGLVERRVRSLLRGEQAQVSVDVVSRALTEARIVVSVAGRLVVTLDDLYGDVPLREKRYRGRS